MFIDSNGLLCLFHLSYHLTGSTLSTYQSVQRVLTGHHPSTLIKLPRDWSSIRLTLVTWYLVKLPPNTPLLFHCSSFLAFVPSIIPESIYTPTAMAQTTVVPASSIWSRKRDLIYFLFFVIHVPVIFRGCAPSPTLSPIVWPWGS